jgi:hypothetical protein
MILHDLAIKNDIGLEVRFEAMLNVMGSELADHVRKFVTTVRGESNISINMRPSVLIKFLALNSYKNIYEWANHTSAISGRETEDIIEEKLDSYHLKRQAFDATFENSHKFNYGALNLSGLGARSYGDYCVVLQNTFAIETTDLVYLSSDSLNTYVSESGDVDLVAIETESSTHEFRHLLAGIKTGDTAGIEDQSNWSEILCSSKEYIEAIFSTEVTKDSIQEIRIAEFDYELYFMFAFENFRRPLGESDRYIIDNFTTILDLVEENHLVITKVNQ